MTAMQEALEKLHCVTHRAQDGVLVGIQPVFDRKELGRYFGKDLVAARRLPVLVVVDNPYAGGRFPQVLR